RWTGSNRNRGRLQVGTHGRIASVSARDTTFLAWNLTSTKARSDEQEVLQVERVRFTQAVRLALNGDIQDSGSVASILALYAKLQLGELPLDLTQRLKRG
ncbi:hypothetical protein ILT44_29805, partial [Microvirga sp. BT689]|uniref:hypothetical protein n=1 Tax=Microvirga arvi TaxID=2778731 RepID=UPI001950C33C